LGINEITQAKPMQAAWASAASFITGGLLPMLVSIFAPLNLMVIYQYGFSIVFLALSAVIAAKAGGSNITKAVIRICFWGTAAMLMTAVVGYLFGVNTG
jgi:VIT1/CCC1 family predicted Fe2+/Mn2+ transporter